MARRYCLFLIVMLADSLTQWQVISMQGTSDVCNEVKLDQMETVSAFYTNQREVFRPLELPTDCTYSIDAFEVESNKDYANVCQIYLELWSPILLTGLILQKVAMFQLQNDRLPRRAARGFTVSNGDRLAVVAYSGDSSPAPPAQCLGAYSTLLTGGGTPALQNRCISEINQESDLQVNLKTCTISLSLERLAYRVQLTGEQGSTSTTINGFPTTLTATSQTAISNVVNSTTASTASVEVMTTRQKKSSCYSPQHTHAAHQCLYK
eukprot:scpid38053/ scgid20917/ 